MDNSGTIIFTMLMTLACAALVSLVTLWITINILTAGIEFTWDDDTIYHTIPVNSN